MQSIKLLLAASIMVSVAGCSGVELDERSFVGLVVEPAPSRLGAYIEVLPSCPVTGFNPSGRESTAAVFATPLASTAANLIVETIQGYIERKKETLSGAFGASGVINYGALGEGRCLVIVRGEIGAAPKEAAETRKPFTPSALKAIGLADVPAFYAEIVLRPEDDKRISFIPFFVSYAQSAALNPGSGRKTVEIALYSTTSTIDRAGDKLPDANAANITHLHLGRLEIGKSYDYGTLKGAEAVQTFSDKLLTGPVDVAAIVADGETPSILFDATTAALETTKESWVTALTKFLTDALIDEDRPENRR